MLDVVHPGQRDKQQKLLIIAMTPLRAALGPDPTEITRHNPMMLILPRSRLKFAEVGKVIGTSMVLNQDGATVRVTARHSASRQADPSRPNRRDRTERTASTTHIMHQKLPYSLLETDSSQSTRRNSFLHHGLDRV